MARAARYYRQTEIELVERAKKKLKRNPETNAFNDAELIAAVESEMEFDPVRERRVKAERIVRSQERPRNTEPDGSAWLPGFESTTWKSRFSFLAFSSSGSVSWPVKAIVLPFGETR